MEGGHKKGKGKKITISQSVLMKLSQTSEIENKTQNIYPVANLCWNTWHNTQSVHEMCRHLGGIPCSLPPAPVGFGIFSWCLWKSCAPRSEPHHCYGQSQIDCQHLSTIQPWQKKKITHINTNSFKIINKSIFSETTGTLRKPNFLSLAQLSNGGTFKNVLLF